MASSSLNSEGQKKIRVMSLDYIKNSLTGKAPNKSVCGCNKDVDPNLDDQTTDIDSDSVSGNLKSSVCKDCGRTKAKHKSGLFKFLSKRLWWKNNLSSESVNSNCTNEKVISDCNKCTFPSVLSDYNSSKDSNLNYNECVDKSYCDVNTSEVVGDDENNETNRPSDNCLDLEASGKDSSECVAQINNGEFDTTAQTENINSDFNLESTSTNNIGLTVDVNNEGTVSVENLEVIPLPSPKTRSLTCELLKLSKYGWYWGPITREEAEEKLQDQPDGAFLVRDSSADHYLLSLSFRSSGKLLHTRIEHSQGLFSFYHQPEQEGFATIGELIDHSVSFSQSAVFCYSRPRSPGHPAFPVRLTKPVSRFTQVRSLQYLCRFVVRQHIRVDIIENLPLPNPIKGYIQEGHY